MTYCALRGDVGAVLVKVEELKRSGNDAALDKWKTKRLQEVATRKKVRLRVVWYFVVLTLKKRIQQAMALNTFLNDLEAQEIRRQDSLRSERRAE